MRILLTLHHYKDIDAGAPGAVMSLCSALQKLGHDAEIISYDDLPRWAQGRKAQLMFPFFVAWRAFRRRRDFDVLDYMVADGWVASLLPRRLRPSRLACNSHGLEHIAHDRFKEACARGEAKMSWKYPFYRGSIHLWLVRFGMWRAQACFVLQRAEAEYARVHRLALPSRIHVSGNGIDQSFLEAALKLSSRSESMVKQALSIAFIGRFTAAKGCTFLMPALSAYLASRPSAQALLLGTNPHTTADVLSSVPLQLHSQFRVIPRFQRDDLPSLLYDYDVFVMPSLSEGFGMAALEAMACGLVPVLTKDVGFGDFCEHNKCGVFVRARDAVAIETTIVKLDTDRKYYQRLQASLEEAVRQFTWTEIATFRVGILQSLGEAGESAISN